MECMYRRVIGVYDLDIVMLICDNENSDHYGHMLNGGTHPTCKDYEIIEIVEPGDTTDAT